MPPARIPKPSQKYNKKAANINAFPQVKARH